jgi:hypothetical protein
VRRRSFGSRPIGPPTCLGRDPFIDRPRQILRRRRLRKVSRRSRLPNAPQTDTAISRRSETLAARLLGEPRRRRSLQPQHRVLAAMSTDQPMNFEIVGYLDLAKYKWHGLNDMRKVDPPVSISSSLPPKGGELRAALVSRGYDPPASFNVVYYRR